MKKEEEEEEEEKEKEEEKENEVYSSYVINKSMIFPHK